MCQEFVAAVLEPLREKFPKAYIIHYMDDILICHQNETILHEILAQLLHTLPAWGLVVALEKVQQQSPFSYLGHLIEGCTVHTQRMETRKDDLKTLNDFQKLLGDINWLCPALKLTTTELSPLFNILKGDSNPSSPRQLTLER
jgi:hypothetical protein